MDLSLQYEILAIGDNRILFKLRELDLGWEDFSFTQEDFMVWVPQFELSRFCQLRAGTGDGLYCVNKSKGLWSVYWQEREVHQGSARTFNSLDEARLFAIASRLETSFGPHPVILEVLSQLR